VNESRKQKAPLAATVRLAGASDPFLRPADARAVSQSQKSSRLPQQNKSPSARAFFEAFGREDWTQKARRVSGPSRPANPLDEPRQSALGGLPTSFQARNESSAKEKQPAVQRWESLPQEPWQPGAGDPWIPLREFRTKKIGFWLRKGADFATGPGRVSSWQNWRGGL